MGNHGYLKDCSMHSLCDSEHLHIFCRWCGAELSSRLGLSQSGVKVGVDWNIHTEEIEWRKGVVEKTCWNNAFIQRELKTNIFKLKDL